MYLTIKLLGSATRHLLGELSVGQSNHIIGVFYP